MMFQALTIGCAVPGDNFQGEVHSIFHRALNLRIRQSSAGEGRLITLVLSTEDDFPQGVRIAAPGGYTLTSLDLQPRQAVTCRGGVLTVGRALTVNLRTAHPWCSDLKSLWRYHQTGPTRANWLAVFEMLKKRQQHNHPGLHAEALFADSPPISDVLTRRAWEALRILWSAGRAGKGAASDTVLLSAVSALVGLGPGLTPSGDDFLVGFLTGAWAAAGRSSQRRAFADQLGQAICQAAHHTGDISQIFLFHAAQGQVSRRLFELAGALCSPSPPEQLREKAVRLMDSGHTSGMDTAAGLLAGLITWENAGEETPISTASPILRPTSSVKASI